MNLRVQIINKSPHELPSYQTTGAAGMDLRAWLQDPVKLEPLERRLIPTGLYIALPEGYEAQIRPRSGMAVKKGITMVNSPGTIDADYRGEIMVAVINFLVSRSQNVFNKSLHDALASNREKGLWSS